MVHLSFLALCREMVPYPDGRCDFLGVQYAFGFMKFPASRTMRLFVGAYNDGAKEVDVPMRIVLCGPDGESELVARRPFTIGAGALDVADQALKLDFARPAHYVIVVFWGEAILAQVGLEVRST